MAGKNTFWKLISEYEIEIPVIQRDYAQGRKSAESIRNTFIKSIEDALVRDGNLDMNFVYGSIEDGKQFIPIDGQQRLTTLFLLHLYLIHATGKNPKEYPVLKKFTYKTRIMTLREFVEKEDLYDVEYIVEQYDSWIPAYDHMNYRYSFDFEKLRYSFEDSKGEIKNGKINEVYALRFLRAAIGLRNIGGLNSKVRATNYVNRSVDFGRFSFIWFDNTGVEDRPEVSDMVESLMAMISTLK